MNLLIQNANVLQPQGFTPDTSVLIRDGRIDTIGSDTPPPGVPALDAGGLLLAPGFIDLHSDAIEKVIRPRPGGSFPLEVALHELDKQLAGNGVTRMYHCLCFGESETNELRTAPVASRIARKLKELAPRMLVHNRVHMRYEVSDLKSVPVLHDLIEENAADLLSFMDHTPGQGQFTCLEHFKAYYSQAEHLTQEQAVELAHTRMAQRGKLGDDHLHELADHAHARGLVLASHDDDTREKVDWVHEMGVQISEFPVTMEAATIAAGLGMGVLMGAPNVLRGGSLTGNLSGIDAIREGACSILGSDYAPMTLLHAAFRLARDGILPLDEALRTISTNPARAMGLEQETGSLQEGLAADLVLIDPSDGAVPRIVGTWVNGCRVHAAPVTSHQKPSPTTRKEDVAFQYS
ncbi:MAG: alpha-D-ribose 1-methylphosphonate 5-triphosphate diphosphatase [Kiritimatiellia bacterium]